MKTDPVWHALIRQVGYLPPVASDEELLQNLNAMVQHFRLGHSPPILIDADFDIPWQEVVHVVDLCRLNGYPRIEFAQRR